MSQSKIAIVTGATSGIGNAVVQMFVNKNISVIANGRCLHKLNKLAEDHNQQKKLLYTHSENVTSPEFMKNLIHTSYQNWNLIPNIVVISAGIGLPGTLLSSEPEKWQQLVETNYLSIMHQLRECAAEFLAQAENENQKYPKDIIVIGSTIGRQVSPFNPVYGSTKFAVHSLVEALRQEICHKNIRVTLIEPGFVKSGFQKTANYDPVWFESIEKDLGPLLEPKDVAGIIDFVVHQPIHVHLDNIRVRPTKQKV